MEWGSSVLLTECDVDTVSRRTISRADGFEERVRVRRLAFKLDGECCEEDNLDRCARGIPEGTAHAILVGDARRLQQSSGPSPRRDDS